MDIEVYRYSQYIQNRPDGSFISASASLQDSGIDIGDITARKALRKQLQCKTFRWYLVSVYPEMRMYSDIIAYGVVRSQWLGGSFRCRQKRRPERGVKREEREQAHHHLCSAL
jgi:hypothetical protein